MSSLVAPLAEETVESAEVPPATLPAGLEAPTPPVAVAGPGALTVCCRSIALSRSAALARSSRSRESSLRASLLADAVPPGGVPSPATLLVPGAVADDTPPDAGADCAAPAVSPDEADGWLPDVLDTLRVSAALEVVAAGADAGALPAVEAGGVLKALEAGGTLGSPLPAAGAAAVAVVLVSAGAVAAGLAGVSTFVSLLQATTAVASRAALRIVNQGRVDMVGSTSE